MKIYALLNKPWVFGPIMLRAKRIRKLGFGQHVTDKQLVEFHTKLAADTKNERMGSG